MMCSDAKLRHYAYNTGRIRVQGDIGLFGCETAWLGSPMWVRQLTKYSSLRKGLEEGEKKIKGSFSHGLYPAKRWIISSVSDWLWQAVKRLLNWFSWVILNFVWNVILTVLVSVLKWNMILTILVSVLEIVVSSWLFMFAVCTYLLCAHTSSCQGFPPLEWCWRNLLFTVQVSSQLSHQSEWKHGIGKKNNAG